MNIQSLFQTDLNVEIQGIQIDNRRIQPGDLFVCIKGYTVDGHQFAKQAEEAGAVAIVSEYQVEGVSIPQIIVGDTSQELPRLAHLFYEQPTHHLNLFGVTGTNGKTTTAYILEHLLQSLKGKTGYIGTNGIRFGETFIEPKNTTPEPLHLQQIFKQMMDEQVTEVAIEVSSHALELHRVDYCPFQVGIFTNLTPEHLDFHPTMEEYYQAKLKLFHQLTPSGTAVINTDDAYGQRLAHELQPNHRVLTYGIEKSADFQASHLQMTKNGTVFTLTSPEGEFTVQTILLGTFNVYNTLGAMTALYSQGISVSAIVEAIATLNPIDGRMELINEGQDFTVIVDYAHTPDGVEKVLEFVQTIEKHQLTVVIGCPGDRDRTKRPVIADLSVQYADRVIFTTDDPHSEDPEAILEEMTTHLTTQHHQVIVDRTQAIGEAICQAQKNDVILIAGRGHEKIQYWKNKHIELDDREVARSMIQRKQFIG